MRRISGWADVPYRGRVRLATALRLGAGNDGWLLFAAIAPDFMRWLGTPDGLDRPA